MTSGNTESPYDRVLAKAGETAPIGACVAYPCENSVLQAVVEANRLHLLKPILVGPAARIKSLATEIGADPDELDIIEAPDSHTAAQRAVQAVRGGQAEILMKGSLHTDELMGAVVDKTTGLRTGRRISHAFVMAVPGYHKALVVTDAAINIFPKLEDKVDILQNAIDLVRSLHVARPKAAILSAVETVTSRIPSTIEAAALCKMADRRQITGALIDGPLAFDNAISKQAAETKGISSEVAGDPDILLVPDLQAGNMLAKQLSFLTHADAAGLVLGARVPIILTSRADTVRVKLASCAVAKLLAIGRREAGTVGEVRQP